MDSFKRLKKAQTVYELTPIRFENIEYERKDRAINLYIKLILIQNAIDSHPWFQIHVFSTRDIGKTYPFRLFIARK